VDATSGSECEEVEGPQHHEEAEDAEPQAVTLQQAKQGLVAVMQFGMQKPGLSSELHSDQLKVMYKQLETLALSAMTQSHIDDYMITDSLAGDAVVVVDEM